jgi:2'-5' RNA ligase
MIWAKFDQNKTFTRLSQSIHTALESFVSPTKFYYPEPSPHITLARFHPVKELPASMFPAFTEDLKIAVASIHIFESIPTPAGVRYDDLGPFFYLS